MMRSRETDSHKRTTKRKIATFTLNNIVFGLEVSVIKEVCRGSELTPIPGAPKAFRGLLNFRGELVSIFDLSICLNLSHRDSTAKRKVLILKTDSTGKADTDLMGLQIDEIGEIVEVKDEEITPPPQNFQIIAQSSIEGVVNLEAGSVVILNMSSIMEEIQTN